MERALTGLKKAEEVAEEIENEAKLKADGLVKTAEEEARVLETEAEKKAKEFGESLLSERMAAADKIAKKIRKEAESSSADLKKKAEERVSSCADEVVDAVLNDLNAGEAGS